MMSVSPSWAISSVEDALPPTTGSSPAASATPASRLCSQRNIMVGVSNNEIVYVPVGKAIKLDKPIDKELINVLAVLSI